MASDLVRELLVWFEGNARDLPWRRRCDPYGVWVSEVMLQQTRVETVIPYYQRWMDRFPTINDLAAASRDDVLALWEGLGYYRRAHHIHEAAIMIAHKHGGGLPNRVEDLRRLPGIGPYTAAAIAAIAFDSDIVALDGNLRRVISRLIDLKVDPRSPQGERRLRSWASEILPAGKASAFNQALMDLGAMVCTPRGPACADCPLSRQCLAYQRGVQEARPIRTPRKPVPHVVATAAVLRRGRKVLIGRRPEGVLLGGLWEFPGGKLEKGESLEAGLRRELSEELGVEIEVGPTLGVFNHAYTHFRVTVHAFQCQLLEGEPQALSHAEIRWVRSDELVDFPMGKVDRAIARSVTAAAASHIEDTA